MSFTRPFELNDWDRFHLYANKIRSLTIAKDDNISKSPIQEVCQRTVACLTPKLKELCVDRSELIAFSHYFMHSGLQEIDFTLPSHKANLEILVDSLTSKTHNLEEARFFEQGTLLRVAQGIHDLDEQLGRLLRGHHSKLRIPQLPFLSTSIIEALPRLEALTDIAMTFSQNYPSRGADYKVNPLMPMILTAYISLYCIKLTRCHPSSQSKP